MYEFLYIINSSTFVAFWSTVMVILVLLYFIPILESDFHLKNICIYLMVLGISWSVWIFIISCGIFCYDMDCPVVRLLLRFSVACGILVLTPRIEPESSALHGWFSDTGPGETSLSLSFFIKKKSINVFCLRLELIYTEIWGGWLMMLNLPIHWHYIYLSLHSIRCPISLTGFAHLLLGFSPRHFMFLML